jgi:hypothetical protein
MKKMIVGGLAVFAVAFGMACATYPVQTHGASNQVTVQARGGHGGGHGGGHRGSNPHMQRPNEARDPHGGFIHDGLPAV